MAAHALVFPAIFPAMAKISITLQNITLEKKPDFKESLNKIKPYWTFANEFDPLQVHFGKSFEITHFRAFLFIQK